MGSLRHINLHEALELVFASSSNRSELVVLLKSLLVRVGSSTMQGVVIFE
jgi:hypothetical protein